MMAEFTHISDDRVRMVDVGEKAEMKRLAVAAGSIYLRSETLAAIRDGTMIKGNVLATARVAATLAVKDTFRIIPMCHAIPLTSVEVDFGQMEDHIKVTVLVRSIGKTGVEMEALTGVSIALLTIWDMVKSAEKDAFGQYPCTRIDAIRVIQKQKE